MTALPCVSISPTSRARRASSLSGADVASFMVGPPARVQPLPQLLEAPQGAHVAHGRRVLGDPQYHRSLGEGEVVVVAHPQDFAVRLPEQVEGLAHPLAQFLAGGGRTGTRPRAEEAQ